MKPIQMLLALLIGFVGCNPPGPTGNEATGRLSEVERTRTEQKQRIAVLETDKASLEEENRRLQTQLAAATGGNGLDLEERQRLLDNRKAGLDKLEDQLIGRNETIEQREMKVTTLEKEFYDKTNMTMTDIGEARHIKEEYENMRSEKDAAVAKAERWLKFVWGVSIALGVSILGICVLLYRSISIHATQRRELAYRQEVAQLLGSAISNQLPPDQATTIVHAFDRLAGIEDHRHVSAKTHERSTDQSSEPERD